MERELAFKIAYWVNQELTIKEPLSFNYLVTNAIRNGFTSHQVHIFVTQELVNGRYYEPRPNFIARVPLPFQSKGRATV